MVCLVVTLGQEVVGVDGPHNYTTQAFVASKLSLELDGLCIIITTPDIVTRTVEVWFMQSWVMDNGARVITLVSNKTLTHLIEAE